MHPIHKIIDFRIIGPYELEIKFEDDSMKKVNLKNILRGSLYSPLKDLTFFNKATLDKEINNIVWPNGADFDPETLYNWKNYEKELISRIEKWN